MTVVSQLMKVRYEGNGVSTEFPTQFAFMQDAHVRAVLRRPAPDTAMGTEDLILDLGLDYTLTGAGDPGGGTLVMAAAPAEGQTLTIHGDVPLTQERAWNNMDVIDTDEIEKSDDKLTRICLQLKEELGRCVKYSVAEPDQAQALEPAELLAARDAALAARDGALASEGAAAARVVEATEAAALSAASAGLAAASVAQVESIRSATELIETQAADHERMASVYAAQAFGASAPAWDPEAAYDFPDVVAHTDGHSYRAVGPVTGESPAASLSWVRLTVTLGDFFEQDDDGDVIPSADPLFSEQFVLDTDGDIIPV